MIITFLTDFGLQDDFVGTCHGVIKRIAPDVQVIDITHGIPPRAIVQGALVHANRHVRDRVREHERALHDRARGDPVRDVDDLHVGRDPLDHAVTGSDEVVPQPEVAQERDEHASATA